MTELNIIAETRNELNRLNLLNLEESAELTKLAKRFENKGGELKDKDEAIVWRYIERLRVATEGNQEREHHDKLARAAEGEYHLPDIE